MHFNRSVITAVRSRTENRITNMHPTSGPRTRDVCACCYLFDHLLMYLVTFLSCSHVQSRGEQGPRTEYRTDVVSALWELLPEPVWEVLGGRNPGAWMDTERGASLGSSVCEAAAWKVPWREPGAHRLGRVLGGLCGG